MLMIFKPNIIIDIYSICTLCIGNLSVYVLSMVVLRLLWQGSVVLYLFMVL